MNFSIGDVEFYLSPDPFTDADKVDSEGFPLLPPGTTDMYMPDTKIPSDVAKKIAETIIQKGIVCPEDAMTIDYTPLELEQVPESSTATTRDQAKTTTTIATLPLRICIDYTKTKLEDDTLVFPLTIESRTGIPELDLSFESVTNFCREIARTYSGKVNDDLHDTNELRIIFGNKNYDFNLVMSAYTNGPCDTTRLRSLKHEDR
jgi:hypothetical protein